MFKDTEPLSMGREKESTPKAPLRDALYHSVPVWDGHCNLTIYCYSVVKERLSTSISTRVEEKETFFS